MQEVTATLWIEEGLHGEMGRAVFIQHGNHRCIYGRSIEDAAWGISMFGPMLNVGVWANHIGKLTKRPYSSQKALLTKRTQLGTPG
jgi:hypothetical protein